jgi:hypothetical protein
VCQLGPGPAELVLRGPVPGMAQATARTTVSGMRWLRPGRVPASRTPDRSPRRPAWFSRPGRNRASVRVEFVWAARAAIVPGGSPHSPRADLTAHTHHQPVTAIGGILGARTAAQASGGRIASYLNLGSGKDQASPVKDQVKLGTRVLSRLMLYTVGYQVRPCTGTRATQ